MLVCGTINKKSSLICTEIKAAERNLWRSRKAAPTSRKSGALVWIS